MFLTVQDAAMAMKCSVDTIRRYIKHKGLPAKKFGGILRIPENEFKIWLETGYTNKQSQNIGTPVTSIKAAKELGAVLGKRTKV